jgi:hypothetical protein
MKKKALLVLVVLLAVVFASVVQGAEKDTFWDSLRVKLQKITPAKNINETTSVAGIRGAKNDSESDMYWKGKDKTESVTEEELQKFNLALDAKMKGNSEQSLKLFDEFLIAYPQSPLRVDALQAADKIKLELGLIKPAAEIKADDAPAKAPAKTTKKTGKKAAKPKAKDSDAK